jgi:steroid delta-isomerase-like uncharacterized protein
MMTDTNKQNARKFFESLDNGDVGACQALLTADFVAHFAGNERAMNTEEFLGFGRALTSSFAHSRHTIESQVAEGDCVETRLIWSGMHVADFNGIVASQRSIKVAAVTLHRFVGDKIAEHRAIIDIMTLMIQIGAIPTPR